MNPFTHLFTEPIITKQTRVLPLVIRNNLKKKCKSIQDFLSYCMKSKVLTCLCAIARRRNARARRKKFCANPRDQLQDPVKFWKDPCSGFRVLFRTSRCGGPGAGAAAGRRLKTETNIASFFQRTL